MPLRSGLTPLELAQHVLERIERDNAHVHGRKRRFRWRAVAIRVLLLALSGMSTIILGLQNLDGWTGFAFALVAVTTVVSALEPFFAWRSLWVLMEEGQFHFYRLRDELAFYIASTPPTELDSAVISAKFDEYQAVWAQLGQRWLEFRRTDAPG
ncbi:SLATT domain-containing protein [Amycolatopsis samaneae]|uniref:SLATT domain-containing protein n=1 Tax=Amycolatopsis samaneae TaxID=664691 RepID=A0ABW5GVZ4_9PSEU